MGMPAYPHLAQSSAYPMFDFEAHSATNLKRFAGNAAWTWNHVLVLSMLEIMWLSQCATTNLNFEPIETQAMHSTVCGSAWGIALATLLVFWAERPSSEQNGNGDDNPPQSRSSSSSGTGRKPVRNIYCVETFS